MKSLRNHWKLITIFAGVAMCSSITTAQEPQFMSDARIRNADATGTYIAAFGGATLHQDFDDLNADSDFGAMAGSKIGYDMGNKEFPAFWGGDLGITTAMELEGFYLENSEDLELESFYFGINGVVRFDVLNNGYLQPYVGAGIGGAYMELAGADDVVLAWQLLDGIQVDVGHGFGVFVEHKWLSAMDAEFNGTKMDWHHQHTLTGGVKYKF